ncbi:hypothetical protein K466DRAFT_505995 [Polyporus arcularius HHB13444]|uniref:F-box domain-containing protein n=1 Tax=Polyporus arcularius HHB13444 TaxID=1314778 RepID=A0A5C3NNS5_9APHY|nr:hypothetical protein K466DRAFT_505995 [Polyporus arcularius HHB13444]
MPTSVLLEIATVLNFRSLLHLRAVSRALLDVVTVELRRSLCKLLQQFVPYPQLLLALLDRVQAYVADTVATRFLLREWKGGQEAGDPLTLYVPPSAYDEVVDHLCDSQSATTLSNTCSTPDTIDYFELVGISAEASLHTPYGIISVCRSDRSDALYPCAARARASHLIAYTNGKFFGCGYPLLTFRHYSLLTTHGTEHPEDPILAEHERSGISIRLFSRQWPELRSKGHDRCAADKWCCPAQLRTFHDPGSLSARFTPHRTNSPLQSRVKWRLDTRPCGGTCLADDPLIPAFVLADVADED